ncbi:MAG: phosphate acetyltransferase [Candidatus Methylumidiphilus sp.]
MVIKGLYLTSAAPYSGKTFVVLGLMEFLAGQSGRIGLFRPLVHQSGELDSFIRLVQARYRINQPVESLYGCTFEAARDLLMEGRRQDLYSLILEKYKRLEAECDFVVCVGTDYMDAAATVELEFNMDMANHLGIPVLPVVKGGEQSIGDIVDSAKMFVNVLRDHLCEVLAVVVTHVVPNDRDSLLAELKAALDSIFPIYALPEDPRLERPTVGEVATALSAQMLSGNLELLENIVETVKIAAMELPHFLGHITEGILIITPGDRSDIILGALTADLSRRFPQIVGLILTGDYIPDPQIRRILAGLGAGSIPIFAVKTDTYHTAIAVDAVESSIGPQDRRKITAALGLIEAAVDMPELMGRVALARSEHVTPLMFQHELILRARRVRKHIVLPEGLDERVLKAAETALLRDVCDITLLGPPDEIRRKISALGLSLERATLVDPQASELLDCYADLYYEKRKHKGISREIARDIMTEPSYFGTMMAYMGHAHGMVSGAIHTTANTIRPALEIIKTQPGFSIVSSVFFMCLADRVLVYGDCAINPDPTAAQLADIAINSALTAKVFGIEPRVAMLSYSTGESGQGPEVDKVREAARMAQERRPDLKIEGPLQYDAAIDAGVAKLKLPGSAVAGHATVFIFPDLNAGNNAYKAVQRAADAVAIGPVLQGLNKPVNDLSRGATVADIVNTIAITAIQAQLEDGQLA